MTISHLLLTAALQKAAFFFFYNKYMNKLGTNFAVFILFFGVAAVEAVQTEDWLKVVFWIAIGLVFLWADVKKS